MSKTHTLNLTAGAATTLKHLLSSVQWYTDVGDLHRAGQLLERPELDLGVAPQEPDGRPAEGEKDSAKVRDFNARFKAWEKAELEPWLNRPVTIDDVTEKQRATMQVCVKFYVARGGLPPNKHTLRLIGELGLSPED